MLREVCFERAVKEFTYKCVQTKFHMSKKCANIKSKYYKGDRLYLILFYEEKFRSIRGNNKLNLFTYNHIDMKYTSSDR